MFCVFDRVGWRLIPTGFAWLEVEALEPIRLLRNTIYRLIYTFFNEQSRLFAVIYKTCSLAQTATLPHFLFYRDKYVSYIVVGCDLWYTQRFVASSGFTNLTFDISHLSLCSFRYLSFFTIFIKCSELSHTGHDWIFQLTQFWSLCYAFFCHRWNLSEVIWF
jgi:hypothetical protein